MKLYTKTGDDGSTGLFGNYRVGKDSLRVEAYGTVDELNAFVGLAGAGCGDEMMKGRLADVQSRLFELGADLSRPPADQKNAGGKRAEGVIQTIDAGHVKVLEVWLDEVCDELPAMKYFVLPGGCELSARLHVARTVCRRAERLCVALSRHEEVSEHVIKYLNRLSDLLFAFARRANDLAGVADVPWKGKDQK
ncbi:cob(I)yrinic acid a,c-diamide adenosyltransferase [Poriferisphaera sp. WC338]|uniref:cob(I)yrinic acid a,c-diamide adenosyltransferase n=1 Tax=Poriferisphaera sp. WC338 TaxID=3425129 RepID=UPI003D81783E